MAVKMARLLVDSTTQREEMLSEYKNAIKKAKSVDSMHQRDPLESRSAYSAFLSAFSGKAVRQPTVTATNY